MIIEITLWFSFPYQGNKKAESELSHWGLDWAFYQTAAPARNVYQCNTVWLTPASDAEIWVWTSSDFIPLKVFLKFHCPRATTVKSLLAAAENYQRNRSSQWVIYLWNHVFPCAAHAVAWFCSIPTGAKLQCHLQSSKFYFGFFFLWFLQKFDEICMFLHCWDWKHFGLFFDLCEVRNEIFRMYAPVLWTRSG